MRTGICLPTWHDPRIVLRNISGLGLLFIPLLLNAASATPMLSLAQAERMALEQDPAIAAARSRSLALENEAVADAQLPDPKLRTGLYNLPLDDFDLQREPSTQLRIGVQQAFPRGDTLIYQSRQTLARAEGEVARQKLKSAKALLAVRQAYLDVYYQGEAQRIVRSSRSLFAAMVDITQVHYGAGGSSNQQDVLRAELEMSRLDDRLNKLENAEDNARADLSRWIGEAAWRSVSGQLPVLWAGVDSGALQERLAEHPEIQLQSAVMKAHDQASNIAREQYKPGWNLGVEYRKRFGDNPDGSDRADMAAVMLTVDMPLFTGKRQDKRLAASQQRANAASYDRSTQLRTLKQNLASEVSNQKRLNERIQRYQGRLVKEAGANAEAALLAYQSGTVEFTGLMRARITELDIRLQAIKLQVDLLKSKARLLYLAAGENQ